MQVIRAGLRGAFMLIAATGLSAQVTTDHDETYDFSAIKSYTIAIGTSWNNQLAERRVVASLDSVLQSRGWRKAGNPDSADAAVVVHGAVGKKQDLRTYYTTTPYGGYRWRGATTVAAEIYEYPYGALVVDIFELRTKTLVFRGKAEGELSTKREANQKKVLKAWNKMFQDFPPKPASGQGR